MKTRRVPTLDDLYIENKRVFLRADMNVPVGDNGEIMDNEKIKQAAKTLKELIERGASVVVGTHQGRPGSSDFITTEPHAAELSKELGIEVEYVDGVFSSEVRSKIMSMKRGDVLMLENLRFMAEENIEGDPRDLIKTHLVQRLAPLFDAYVNDAFQAAHRSQPSLVAFPYLLPSAAGRNMQKMLNEMLELDSVKGRRILILGGAKVPDKLKVMVHSIRNGKAAEVLTGGLVGMLLAVAAGHKLDGKMRKMKDLDLLIPAAREILSEASGRVLYPVDFLVKGEDGSLENYPVYAIPENGEIVDIGVGTIELYKERLKGADIAIANGPMGIFERPESRRGTLEIVNAMEKFAKISVLCGGHLSAAADMVGAKGSRVYTAGGAVMYGLAGLPLPAVDALRESVAR
ncbi:MAG: phosphoglycerate kinase [Candidatus Korarchaeota archaeon NZ13-K]|nr:MAG: phosphoglycerate kinase [Candidatus Korarchaeota archaeon NZ13-K]